MGNDWFHEYFINELKAIGRKPTSNMQHEVVDSLPSSGNEQTIYFVKNDSSSSNNHYDEYVWISSSSTFEKIGSTQIDDSTTQSDWNQNDEMQPDYVKNRPFYTGNKVETMLVEESTVAFAENSGLYIAEFPSTFEATVGETYKVSWDGTVYESICVCIDDLTVIGNLSFMGGGSDTGEPFFMVVYNAKKIIIFTADTSASHTFSISGMVAPVVKIDAKYLPIPFKPYGESYLTFSSPSSFTLSVYDNIKSWDGTLEYFSSDETWTIWKGISSLSAEANGGEYVLYLRGTGNTVITGNNISYRWVLTGTDIKCIGNIENLLDYATVASGAHPTMSENCYYEMFQNCTNLTQAPELPATTLANFCYAGMFQNCTNLTQAPELPATTLATSCYYQMFRDCTNLTRIPALPATTLANYCYDAMFYGCTNLKLSSTTTDEYTQKYRIPSSGIGEPSTNSLMHMFAFTGGTFAGTPSINTTYYLSSYNMIIRETEIATLNGYIGSMIDAAISEYADTAEYIIHSSTEGSTKKFKITVDDTGTISATEVT